MSNFAIRIEYPNGSANEFQFADAVAARVFARDKISYSGGRVAKVSLSDRAGGSRETLWQHDWDAVSQFHGLNTWS